MSDFLSYFDKLVEIYPLHLEISYSKITDYIISIWKKGGGENGEDLELVNVQGCDISLCFAKAHVALKEWLLENERWS